MYPKKFLSQSFLKSRGIAAKIVDALEFTKRDTVLEVGPGTGILTDFLVRRAGKILLVERDREMVDYLKDKYGDKDNLEIYSGDILKQDFGSVIGREKVKIISNLPYSISKEFLYMLLEKREFFSLAVLTLQKEVAQRLTGEIDKKTYGLLSVMYHCYCDTEILFPVPPSFFFPRPKVSSLVVRIKILNKPRYHIDDLDGFFKFVKKCFSSRRKMLRNLIGVEGKFATKRAEELTPEEFVNLWRENK